MSDLISRKAVLKILYDISSRNYGSFFGHGINKACDVIEHAEIAFDKEKALKELQHASNVSRVHWKKHDDMGAFHEMRAFESAIEIVKKGGIE